MFNVKDILAAVRVCVLGALLFAPLTSHALPANDNHVALPDTQVANAPNTRDERQASISGWDAQCNSQCESDCLRVYDSCMETCGGQEQCMFNCSLNHSFCVYSCNAATWR